MSHESRIIPPHGGYQKLKSYEMSEIVYDATVRFCELFLDKSSRTADQMTLYIAQQYIRKRRPT